MLSYYSYSVVVFLLVSVRLSHSSSIPHLHIAHLFINISRVNTRPVLLIVLHRIVREISRPRNGSQTLSMLLKLLQPRRRQWLRLVNAVNLDAMTTLRNMQTPIPSTPYFQRLGIERIVPATRQHLDPALSGHGQLHVPGAPGEFVLLGHVFNGDGIPREAAVG